ncbi:hypothetical protein INR49_028371 [Caranx melampygus]|nr:hypothetical protein INR49_028371 [Caranx melampygus]
MFTCQHTPRMSPHTSVKTHTASVSQPQHSRAQPPPTAQHRTPGFCHSNGHGAVCHGKRAAVIRAKRVTPSGLRKAFQEGNACSSVRAVDRSL